MRTHLLHLETRGQGTGAIINYLFNNLSVGIFVPVTAFIVYLSVGLLVALFPFSQCIDCLHSLTYYWIHPYWFLHIDVWWKTPHDHPYPPHAFECVISFLPSVSAFPFVSALIALSSWRWQANFFFSFYLLALLWCYCIWFEKTTPLKISTSNTGIKSLISWTPFSSTPPIRLHTLYLPHLPLPPFSIFSIPSPSAIPWRSSSLCKWRTVEPLCPSRQCRYIRHDLFPSSRSSQRFAESLQWRHPKTLN